jgi:hypothetical protein
MKDMDQCNPPLAVEDLLSRSYIRKCKLPAWSLSFFTLRERYEAFMRPSHCHPARTGIKNLTRKYRKLLTNHNLLDRVGLFLSSGLLSLKEAIPK